MAMELTPQQALQLWQGTLALASRDGGPDLSVRQMAIMLSVYLSAPPHTVRGLAERLRISKPAVVRALDALGELDFLRRRRDEADRRNVLIQRTVKGSVFLREFAEHIMAASDQL